MLPFSLTTVDAIVIICITIGAIQGACRGISGELARLLGAVCAFVVGALLHAPLGTWIATHTRLLEQEARLLTYVSTVIASLILWALFHRLIKKILQLILTKGFDRAAGIPAGMLRITTLAAILFIAMNIWPSAPLQQYFGPNSFFGRQTIRLVPAVQQQLDEHNISSRPKTQPAEHDSHMPEHNEEETTP